MPLHRMEFTRILKIHQAILKKEYPSVEKLARVCEVDQRTIKRDIAMLKDEFDAPIKVSRHLGGYYYERPFRLAPEPFTDQEVLALSLSMQIADTFRNMPFVPAVKGALQKLREMQMETSFDVGTTACISMLPDAEPPDNVQLTIFFNDLLRAIERRQQVSMRYYSMSSDEETERVLDPYHLYHYEGLWYVYGYCHLRETNRDFAICRIQRLDLLPTTFTPPDRNKILSELASRFANVEDEPVDVKIWFDDDAGRRICERIWHPSQQIEKKDDGSCVLSMTVTGLDTVTRWVLSFGPHAKPLAPKPFVDRVKKAIREMARTNNIS